MLKVYFKVFLLSACLSLSFVSAGARQESYRFRNMDVEDGLSQNCVNAIMQDRCGFLWFGTRDGLNRYDGNSFKVYRSGSSDGLVNSFITCLYEDTGGRIWVGTDMGLSIYDPELERFEAFNVSTEDDVRIKKTVLQIVEREPGKILVAVHASGIFEYDTVSGLLVDYPLEGYGDVRDFAVDKNGRLWIAFFGQLCYTDDTLDNMVRYAFRDGTSPFSGNPLASVVPGDYNSLYIGSEKDGVWELNLMTQRLEHLHLGTEGCFVREMMMDDDNLWIGSESGIYIYDIGDDSCIRLAKDMSDPYSISDNAVYSIFRDSGGTVWVGTFFGGVDRWSASGFDIYYPTSSETSLGGSRVREICEGRTDDELWIGTEDKGLFRFDRTTGEFHRFMPSVSFPNIHGLCFDGRNLWIGTFSDGIWLVDLYTGEMHSWSAAAAQIPMDNYVFSVCKSSTGDIYIGTSRYLVRYGSNDGTFSRIKELDNNLIYDIKEDSAGNLWVATYANGLFCYDGMREAWRHYVHSDDPGSLPTDKVIGIFEDSGDRIWISTQGGGVCLYIPEEEVFDIVDTGEGLPNDVVFQIEEDNDGFFWMTTNAGLVRFDPRQKKVMRVYTGKDGLLGGQFNYKSSFKDADGRIWFGMTEGLVSFDPETMSGKENHGLPVFTELMLSDGPVVPGDGSILNRSIMMTHRLVLKHNQNTFSLRVSVLGSGKLSPDRPEYMMEGLDAGWQPVPDSYLLSWSHLPAGHYTLLLRCGDAVSGFSTRELDIEIKPHFLMSTVAISMYILMTVAAMCMMLYLVDRRNSVRRRTAMEKFRQSQEKELYESKIEFFTYITHEIRTPLTLIKGPLESIIAGGTVTDRDAAEDLAIMSRNVDRLNSLVNQLLDFRSVEKAGGHLSLNYLRHDIVAALDNASSQFLSVAKRKGVDFSFTHGMAGGFFADVDIEAFTKIVTNLLVNAFKYCDSYVRLSLEQKDMDEGMFLVKVENDGEPVPDDMTEKIFSPFVRYTGGRNQGKPGIGLGLSIARSFAEMHGGSLKVYNRDGHTCFELVLPVVQEMKVETEPHADTRQVEHEENDMTDSDDSRPTVLVVEDDRQMRHFLHRHIGHSYSVITADNGEEALKLLRSQSVDMVISDVMMPVMDGMELCRKLKEDIGYSHIPVILLTAKTMDRAMIEGAEAGADAYIGKPFSMEYLMAVIENLLRNRSRLKEIFMKYSVNELPAEHSGLSPADEQFLAKVFEIIRQNMSDPEFNMADVASSLYMSRSAFYRKIKGVLDMSPAEYLRVERLKEAARLLKAGNHQVSEVCYMVGFNNLSWFAKCFSKQFGVLPREWAAANAANSEDSPQ